MTVPVHTLGTKASQPLWEGFAPRRTRPQTTLLPGVFLLLTTLGTPALASGNEGWANEVIEHTRQHTFDPDGGARPRPRRSAVERLNGYRIEEAQIRSRHHARRHDRTEEYHAPRRARAHHKSHRKFASLGRSVVPAAIPAVSNAIAEV